MIRVNKSTSGGRSLGEGGKSTSTKYTTEGSNQQINNAILKKLIRPYPAVVTVFVFLVIGVLSLIRLNIHFLDPFTQGIKDFDLTDIVYSRLRNQEVRLDDRIVLVNTGQPDRALMAAMLKRISEAQPKVIGIDVLYAGRQNAAIDSALQAAIQHSDNVVLASTLENYRDDLKRFQSETGVDTFFSNYARLGYANFPSMEVRTIRFFSPLERTREGVSYSFATRIAEQYAPEKVEKMLKRKNELERIHFSSTEDNFIQFEPEAILDTAVDLKPLLAGKIILMGYNGDPTSECTAMDKFHTPLNVRYSGRSEPDMHGIVIHANIIRMILDGKFINKIPAWLSLLLAILVCYGNVSLLEWVHERYPRLYHPITRTLQVAEFALLFFLISLLFYWFRLKWDFTAGLLALALYFDVLLSYEAFSSSRNQAWINKLPKIFKLNKSG